MRSHYYQHAHSMTGKNRTHHPLKTRFDDDLTDDIIQLVVCHTVNPGIDISVRPSRLLVSLHNEDNEGTYISVPTILTHV